LDKRFFGMLRSIINRSGTIDYSVVDILQKIYKENLDITFKDNDGFNLSNKRRIFKRS